MRFQPATYAWAAALVLAAAAVSQSDPSGAILALPVLIVWAGVFRQWRSLILLVAIFFGSMFLQFARQWADGRFHPHVNGIITTCNNNLRQLSAALLSYESRHGSFPLASTRSADGELLYGWRAEVLLYLDLWELHKNWNRKEPWDSASNGRLLSEAPWIFRCPEDGLNRTETSYIAVVDPRTAWPPDRPGRMKDAYEADGSTNTILLMEVFRRGIPWAKPEDISFDEAVKILTTSPSYETAPHFTANNYGVGSIHVAFMDGTVQLIDLPLTSKTAVALLTVNGHEPVDRNSLASEVKKLAVTPRETTARYLFAFLTVLPGPWHFARWVRSRRGHDATDTVQST